MLPGEKGDLKIKLDNSVSDFTDQEAVQRFFLQEVQLGEELLAQGDVEAGVEHLGLAVAVCGQPHSLLGVLQQTLPPQVAANFSIDPSYFSKRASLLVSPNCPLPIRQLARIKLITELVGLKIEHYSLLRNP